MVMLQDNGSSRCPKVEPAHKRHLFLACNLQRVVWQVDDADEWAGRIENSYGLEESEFATPPTAVLNVYFDRDPAEKKVQFSDGGGITSVPVIQLARFQAGVR